MSYYSHHRVSRSMPVNVLHMENLLKRHRCDLVCVQLSQSRSHSHMSVPPTWEHILCAQLLPTRAVQAPPLRILVQEQVFSLNHEPFDGFGYIDTVASDLMHHQYCLSVLQWNPGPARRNHTNIIAAACGRFHAVILQEASDHVPHISDQFIAYTGNTDLAILINKDTFEPDPMVFAFNEDSTSKGTWGMVLLIVRGLLRRPSLSGTPTVTFLLSTRSQCCGQKT